MTNVTKEGTVQTLLRCDKCGKVELEYYVDVNNRQNLVCKMVCSSCKNIMYLPVLPQTDCTVVGYIVHERCNEI